MPLYEFRCPKCESLREVILPIKETENPQLCTCGGIMNRVFSSPKVIMKPLGRDMALDTLNSKDTGHMKPHLKKMAAQGLENPSKTIW